MQNWKDYVSFQPAPKPKTGEEFSGAMAFYLTANFDTDNRMFMVIQKAVIGAESYKYNEAEIGQLVENAIREFPEFEVQKFNLEHTRIRKWYLNSKFPFIHTYIRDNKQVWTEINERRVANRIAQNTRRGRGNTRFEDYMFYNGSNTVDRPIIVSEYNGKYAILKHPKFADYGFKIVEVDGENPTEILFTDK